MTSAPAKSRRRSGPAVAEAVDERDLHRPVGRGQRGEETGAEPPNGSTTALNATTASRSAAAAASAATTKRRASPGAPSIAGRRTGRVAVLTDAIPLRFSSPEPRENGFARGLPLRYPRHSYEGRRVRPNPRSFSSVRSTSVRSLPRAPEARNVIPGTRSPPASRRLGRQPVLRARDRESGAPFARLPRFSSKSLSGRASQTLPRRSRRACSCSTTDTSASPIHCSPRPSTRVVHRPSGAASTSVSRTASTMSRSGAPSPPNW